MAERLSLADRVLSSRVLTVGVAAHSLQQMPELREEWRPRLQRQREEDRSRIAMSHVFELSNVADYFARFGLSEQRLVELPMLRPPFEPTWVEFCWPLAWKLNGRMEHVAKETRLQLGLLIHSCSPAEADKWLFRRLGIHPFPGESAAVLAAAERLVLMQQYMADVTPGRPCVPCRAESVASVALNGEGMAIHENPMVVYSAACRGVTAADMTHVADETARLQMAASIACLAIGLCHCRNVEIVDSTEEFARPEKWHRRMKTPRLVFRTLRINADLTQVRRDGPHLPTGRSMPLHQVRGHLVRYTEEKPLFGKYAGVFWRQAHRRGSLDAGQVVKNYEVVKSPEAPGEPPIAKEQV